MSVFASLLGLTGLAFVQPLLSVFGENPTIFAAANVDEWRLVALGIAVATLPAIALWLLWRVSAAVMHKGLIGHAVLAGALFGLAMVQWVKAVGVDQSWLQLGVATLGAIGMAIAVERSAKVREWTVYLSPLPVLAGLLFLTASPAADLIGQPDPAFAFGEGGAEQPDVVLLVIDELPTLSILDETGGIDAQRFPEMAAFANTATWYPNYTTVAPYTDVAVPSILAGTWPRDVPPIMANFPDNLFTAFAPTHHLAVFEKVSVLCNFVGCSETGPGEEATVQPSADISAVVRRMASVWLDRVTPGNDPEIRYDEFVESFVIEPRDSGTFDPFAEISEDPLAAILEPTFTAAKPQRFKRFIETFDEQGPSLYYLHITLPHFPFRFYPNGVAYGVPLVGLTEDSAPYPGATNETPWVAAFNQQRHLLQSQYVDNLVGEMMGQLKETGVFDDALVAVVSDHGASFETGTAYRRYDNTTLDGTAFTPLLIKLPGQEVANVDQSNVMSPDLLPTLASIATVELNAEVDGVVIGSDAMLARGNEKLFWDKAGGDLDLDRPLTDPFEFSLAEHRPDAADRAIGGLDGSDDNLAGLHRFAGIESFVGSRFDDLVVGTDGIVAVVNLESFVDGTGSPPQGIVEGEVRNGPTGPLVLAVDGVIVAGSAVAPFREWDRFFAMMYPQRFLGTASSLQFGIATADGIVELEVERW